MSNNIHQSGKSVTTDKLALIHHYHLTEFVNELFLFKSSFIFICKKIKQFLWFCILPFSHDCFSLNWCFILIIFAIGFANLLFLKMRFYFIVVFQACVKAQEVIEIVVVMNTWEDICTVDYKHSFTIKQNWIQILPLPLISSVTLVTDNQSMFKRILISIL